MSLIRRALPLALAAALLLAAVPATARTLTVWPDEFTPVDRTEGWYGSPMYVSGALGAGTVTFTAPVRLPAGATITGVKSMWSGMGASSRISGFFMGRPWTLQGEQLATLGMITGPSPGGGAPFELTWSVDGAPKVLKTWKYYFSVSLFDEYSRLYGVQITYQPPPAQ